MYQFENELYQKGIVFIAGVDEVGRGPLAGPVVAAAVIFKKGAILHYVDDSKKLTKRKRDLARLEIEENAVSIGVSFVSVEEIDLINIYQASKKAMKQAIDNLEVSPEFLLIDAMPLDISILSNSIIKGDTLSISIAAASIIAKTKRDAYMVEMDKLYPVYDFKNNKGYGTKKHLKALEQFGFCPIHRKTFNPVRTMVSELKKKEKVAKNG